MGLLDRLRKRGPEEGDDLDGCALNFSQEKGEPVPLEPEPDEEEGEHGA